MWAHSGTAVIGEISKLPVENVPKQEYEGVERLTLAAGAELFVERQAVQKRGDFSLRLAAQIVGAQKSNQSLHPHEIALFGRRLHLHLGSSAAAKTQIPADGDFKGMFRAAGQWTGAEDLGPVGKTDGPHEFLSLLWVNKLTLSFRLSGGYLNFLPPAVCSLTVGY
jgi:hypothetical protein